MKLTRTRLARRALIGSLFVLITTVSLAQEGLTGKWTLKEKKHLDGPEIVNALPRSIEITTEDGYIIIDRILFDANNHTYHLTERLPLNGSKNESESPNGHKIISYLLTADISQLLVENSNITRPGGSEQPYGRTDSLALNGKQLFVKRIVKGTQSVVDAGYYVQTDSFEGAKFSQATSWNEIVDNARATHKKIIVDCFASWCVPCKLMDAEVYSSPIIGQLVNRNYILVKLQFDSTATNNSTNSPKYVTAKRLERELHVDAYPTTLFFDDSGNPIHKAVGVMNIDQFQNLIGYIEKPDSGFYSMLNKFRKDTLNQANRMKLALMAKSIDDKSIADSVARTIIQELSAKKAITLSEIRFLASFNQLLSIHSALSNQLFTVLSSNQTNTAYRTAAGIVTDALINRELIVPALASAQQVGKTPDWFKLYGAIKQYTSSTMADKQLFAVKTAYYKKKKDWKNYTANLVKSISLEQPANANDANYYLFTLNNSAWEVFLHSQNPQELQAAIHWMDRVIAFAPSDYNAKDTKANLLYKAGKKTAAIDLEQQVVNDAKAKGDGNDQYAELLNKMKKGISTW